MTVRTFYVTLIKAAVTTLWSSLITRHLFFAQSKNAVSDNIN